MSKWRPIETAPKDGTHILIWSVGAVYYAWWEKMYHLRNPRHPRPEDWTPDWQGQWMSDMAEYEPTHWMPLPKSPDVL